MRKIKIKKDFPKRHQAILMLRKTGNATKEIITKEGHSIYLNLEKHFLLQKPYKNQEYNKEMIRHLNQQIKKEKEETK